MSIAAPIYRCFFQSRVLFSICQKARFITSFVKPSKNRQAYTIDLDDAKGDNPDVFIVLIKHGRHHCVHIAVPLGNNDIEDTKAVGAQAVLYRTTQDDAELYFAIFDICLPMAYFCVSE